MVITTGILMNSFSVSYVLNQWASMGVFAYVLPFLLVFALVYGILTKSKIFGEDNKAVNAIISLAFGLLSLVGDFVPNFFQTIIPMAGVALSVLLVAIILLGLFYDGSGGNNISKAIMWSLFVIGAIAFIIITYSSFSSYTFAGSSFWNMYGSGIITLLILGGIIALIVATTKGK